MLWNILLGAFGIHNGQESDDDKVAAKTADKVCGSDEAHVSAKAGPNVGTTTSQSSGRNSHSKPKKLLPIVDTTPGDESLDLVQTTTSESSSKDTSSKRRSRGVGVSSASSEDVASAVATDITAYVTEPSSPPASPTASNRTENIVLTGVTTEMVRAISEDRASFAEDRDTPEDLPSVIHTSPGEKSANKRLQNRGTPKGKSKSVISKASSARSSRTRSSSIRHEKNPGSNHPTALATSMGQKQEAIATSFANIIEELGHTPRNQDDGVRSQLDETMEQQQLLISQLQEVITRLEADARREESENAKLTRRLRSARKRLSGDTTTTIGGSCVVTEASTSKRRGGGTKKKQQQLGSVQSRLQQHTIRSVKKAQEMFPVSEIVVSASAPVDWDELTCLFNEPKHHKSLGTRYEF